MSEMAPVPYRVRSKVVENAESVTLCLEPTITELSAPRPGEFMMLYAYGVGEIAISVSGDPMAVPAISRCAHVYLRVKRSRKHAAVIEPAAGPPILAISAKLDFNCSLYSSPIGKRHAVSLASLPAANNSSANLSCASS